MAPRETENNAYAKIGVTNKEHYGVLWYFLEWSIGACRSISEIPTLPYTRSLERYRPRAEPPSIGHNREYTPPPPGEPRRVTRQKVQKLQKLFTNLHRELNQARRRSNENDKKAIGLD